MAMPGQRPWPVSAGLGSSPPALALAGGGGGGAERPPLSSAGPLLEWPRTPDALPAGWTLEVFSGGEFPYRPLRCCKCLQTGFKQGGAGTVAGLVLTPVSSCHPAGSGPRTSVRRFSASLEVRFFFKLKTSGRPILDPAHF